MRRVLLMTAALGLALTATACDFDVEASVNDTVAFDLGSLDGACEGSDSEEGDRGVTAWTKSIEGDACRVDFTWDGDLIEMDEVREKVDAEIAANDPGVGSVGVRIDGVEIGLEALRMTDGDGGAIPSPTMDEYGLSIDMLEEELLAIDGTDVLEIVASDQTFPLSKDALLAASQAFRERAPVPAHAEGTLLIPLTELDALAAAGETRLEVDFRVDVTATAEASVF